MNIDLPTAPLPDIQLQSDTRGLSIQRAGVRDVKHPLNIKNFCTQYSSIGIFDLMVGVHKTQRGTHMSRFLEVLHERMWDSSLESLWTLANIVKERLASDSSYLAVKYSLLLEKEAPVSKKKSYIDYDMRTIVQSGKDYINTTHVMNIPVTTLCPCSKEISEYGAHNQRSEIILTLNLHENIDISKLIKSVESKASCQVYGILKREDEKYVTEYAYNNPKFAEDIVRDVACVLKDLSHINYFKVEANNIESIHNHIAYAMLEQKL